MQVRLLLVSLGLALALTAPAAASAAGDPLLRAIQRAEAAGALPAPQGLAYRDVLARI